MRDFLTNRSGLTAKLVIPFVSVFSAAIIFLALMSMHFQRTALMHSLEKKSESLARNLSSNITESVAMGEMDAIQKKVLATKAADDEIAYALVVGAAGTAIASTDASLIQQDMRRNTFEREAFDAAEFMRRPSPIPGVFEVVMPLRFQTNRLGVLRIGFTTAVLKNTVRTTILSLALVAALALFGGISVYFIVAQRLLTPLRTAVNHLADLARGTADLTARLPVLSEDESAELSRNFNAFLASMSRLVGQIRQASEQIRDSTEVLTKIAGESASIQSDMVNSMGTLSAGTGELAQSAQRIAHSLTDIGTRARTGSSLATEVVQKTRDLEQSSAAAARLLVELSDCSKRIGSIVDVITKITGQTNLLSLNATIEAARAGEAGKGFAIVADEVRRLADTSRQNAERIVAVVKEVQEKSQRAMEITGKADAEVRNSLKLTRSVEEQFVQISQEVERINSEMAQLAASTEQVAASTEESGAAIEQHSAGTRQVADKAAELNDIVNSLRSVVGQFKT